MTNGARWRASILASRGGGMARGVKTARFARTNSGLAGTPALPRRLSALCRYELIPHKMESERRRLRLVKEVTGYRLSHVPPQNVPVIALRKDVMGQALRHKFTICLLGNAEDDIHTAQGARRTATRQAAGTRKHPPEKTLLTLSVSSGKFPPSSSRPWLFFPDVSSLPPRRSRRVLSSRTQSLIRIRSMVGHRKRFTINFIEAAVAAPRSALSGKPAKEASFAVPEAAAPPVDWL